MSPTDVMRKMIFPHRNFSFKRLHTWHTCSQNGTVVLDALHGATSLPIFIVVHNQPSQGSKEAFNSHCSTL
ncbi:unnamed protein product [Allacma fusca]|uniref:Uncharacterized protein n=1 Tax=Allacma fusca TaxID=39272 RepID=A0A8J2P572_9HEXA|nr:unnamed protein product [Allacma fusca]